MFRKEQEKAEERLPAESAEVEVEITPPNQDMSPRSVSYVGPTVTFKGEISANEGLTIEGIVEGRITHENKHLTVGKQGRVYAEIHAKVIEIRGRVEGDIYGEETVRLYSTANVSGTIHCTRILMDDGAEFNGRMNMTGEVEQAEQPELVVAEADEKIAKIAS